MVSTNHFVDPSWHLQTKQEDIWFTVKRRQNLLHLANEYYAVGVPITVSNMQAILHQRLISNGATDMNTVYQVIAEPSKKIIWIRLPRLQNAWQKIKLQTYFKH